MSAQVFGGADWMPVAEFEIGVSELPGPQHNERVLQYLRTTNLGRWGRRRDETPWCAAFVNWCLQTTGRTGTKSAAARSFAKYGTALARPEHGAIAVFERGRGGHVGFVTDWDRESIAVLGGNQRNKVCVREYPASRLIGYRWPV